MLPLCTEYAQKTTSGGRYFFHVERSLAEREGLQVTERGVAVDARTLATNLPGVFAGGDAVLGADLAVRADRAHRAFPPGQAAADAPDGRARCRGRQSDVNGWPAAQFLLLTESGGSSVCANRLPSGLPAPGHVARRARL